MKQLVKELKQIGDGLIYPPYLQVVCSELFERYKIENINPKLLGEFGKKNNEENEFDDNDDDNDDDDEKDNEDEKDDNDENDDENDNENDDDEDENDDDDESDEDEWKSIGKLEKKRINRTSSNNSSAIFLFIRFYYIKCERNGFKRSSPPIFLWKTYSS